MIPLLVVVERPADWPLSLAGVQVVSPRAYLCDPVIQQLRRGRVFNLCREYSYQSSGYYVSLLAEARGHRPMPSVATLRRLHGRAPFIGPDLDALIQRSLAKIQSDEFVLSVYFGRNLAERHNRLARALFNVFPAPALRATFVRGRDRAWRLRSAGLLAAREIPPAHHDFVLEAAGRYFRRPTRVETNRPPRYLLGVVTDPEDPTPPSDAAALRRFARAAERVDVACEFIGPDDLGTIGEYDALLLRATTAVENFTFRVATRARAEGIPVIDDPDSILRCTNKVFLAELFERHAIPAPRTRVLYRGIPHGIGTELGFPLVLKQPDSAFSRGVVKVADEASLTEAATTLFRETDLLIAQEFVPTPFDWRIGVLEGRPLFACRYFMARGHWQIYRSIGTTGSISGKADTIPVDDAPPAVVATALQAAGLIGDGLYGVDLKEINGRPLVIEVNDNPSIDYGIEDLVLGQQLYDEIVDCLVRRIEARTAPR
jgi:glutathione synthase/RimK-type ligase-like ATP-grasp enzyme